MTQQLITPTPHDAAFKQVLSSPAAARDFMQIHLPSHLLEICDLSSLKLENGSFIDEDLRAYYSDVLYSLKTHNGSGYIQVLIEHQSSPDRNMAFRLMRYAIAAMQRHLDAGHKQLPLVIPMLFYAGQRSPYPYAMNWFANFECPDRARKLYSSDFPLIDVTVIPDEEIMQHRRVAAITLLQKHIRQRNFNELLEQMVTLIRSEYVERHQLITLVNYIVQTGESQNGSAVINSLIARVPEYKETFMIIGDHLRQEGKRLEQIGLLQRLLQDNFPHEVILRLMRCSESELAEIKEELKQKFL